MRFFDEWEDGKICVLFVAMLTHPEIFGVEVDLCQFDDLKRVGNRGRERGWCMTLFQR